MLSATIRHRPLVSPAAVAPLNEQIQDGYLVPGSGIHVSLVHVVTETCWIDPSHRRQREYIAKSLPTKPHETRNLT